MVGSQQDHLAAAPAPDDVAAVLRPRLPHDDLTFEQLAGRYNFRRTSDRRRVFARLVIKECEARPAPVRVLDVGCGRGIGRQPEYQWAMRLHIDEYWGLEPDESVAPPAGLFDQHRYALMETADLPADYFDIAYSYMVMEHVAEPEGFMAAVLRCLKPGGVYLMITPNRRHYFTRTALALHALRLDELVLRMIKRRTDYHYGVLYRFNDERRIRACAERVGFMPPQFAYLEAHGPTGYLRGPLMAFYHLLALKRWLIRRPRSLLSLVCRLTKAPDPRTDK